ncbi:MAG: septal ring lytic transglycosylase RlpA family protein [Bacteroidota bacterium]
MRKLCFLIALSAFSYVYLQAQAAKSAVPANYGKEFAEAFQPNDLYHLEIKRAKKEGFALQVATFSSYPNVVKYATELQGKWFDDLLVKMDQAGGQTVYKVLIGPFPDKNAAVSYQQFAKKKGLDGFVVPLDTESQVDLTPTAPSTPPATTPAPTKPAVVEQPVTTPPAIQNAVNRIVQTGEASYYHKKFHGNVTAYGEKYDKRAMTAAHWTLPYNSKVKVCRLDTNQCVEVRINDRGPNPAKAKAKNGQPRIIDLSGAAAKVIDLTKAGVAQVSLELLN